MNTPRLVSAIAALWAMMGLIGCSTTTVDVEDTGTLADSAAADTKRSEAATMGSGPDGRVPSADTAPAEVDASRDATGDGVPEDGAVIDADLGDTGLRWYVTCGDPVCRADLPADAGVPACTASVGSPCSTPNQRCDYGGTCGTFLVCAASDPTLHGCPISSASRKRDISYVSPVEEDRLAREVESTRLATYAYRNEASSDRRHLGFIIEDQSSDSMAVAPERDMVDLYGYTSMVVAALKSQRREIDALRAEIAHLRTTCEAGAASRGSPKR